MNRGAWIALGAAIVAAAFLGGRMLPLGSEEAVQANGELQQTVNTLRSRVASLEQRLAERTVEVSQYRALLARVESLEGKVQTVEAVQSNQVSGERLSRLVERVAAVEERVRNASSGVDSDAFQALQAQVSDVEGEVDQLRRAEPSGEALRSLRERIAALEEQVSSGTNAQGVGQLRRRVDELQGATLSPKEVQALQDRVTSLSSTLQGVRRQVVSATNAQERKLADQQEQLSRLVDGLEELRSQIDRIGPGLQGAVKLGVVDMAEVNDALYRLQVSPADVDRALEEVGSEGEYDLILRRRGELARELIVYAARGAMKDVTEEVVARLEAIKRSD